MDYSPWYDGWGEEPNPDRRSSDRPVEELDHSANTLIDWIDCIQDERMPVAAIQARCLTEKAGIAQHEWLAKQEQRLKNKARIMMPLKAIRKRS